MLVPHVAAAEGQKACNQREKGNGGYDDERTRHG
jgi:hypothetical protein